MNQLTFLGLKMPRENKSQYAILGLLSKQCYSGYEMKEKINKISHFHWSESNAQLYPLLKELEKEGMVKSQIDPKSGARKKRVYEITQLGLEHLTSWLIKPAASSHYREEMLLKLSLGQHLSPDVLLSHLQDYMSQIQTQQKFLVEMVSHINEAHKNRPDFVYLEMTYDYADALLQAKLQWAQKTMDKISLIPQ